MTQAKATPISALVGGSLRSWRKEEGLTQDEVARAARQIGVDWTRATVAAIETGRRDVSLGEFLALPFIVNRLTDGGSTTSRRRLVGFVARQKGTRDVALTDDCWLFDASNLTQLVNGGRVGTQDVAAGAVKPRPGVRREIASRVESALDAEQKAARSLGVTAMEVRLASYTLWGRSLTDEREERVGRKHLEDSSPPSLQAHRGHLTRELLKELERVIGKPRHRKTSKEQKQ